MCSVYSTGTVPGTSLEAVRWPRVWFCFGLFFGLGVLGSRTLFELRVLIGFRLVVRIQGSGTLAWVVRVPAMSCGFASFGPSRCGFVAFGFGLAGHRFDLFVN
jgi:hypothetical protein